jgi:hypothetical protein
MEAKIATLKEQQNKELREKLKAETTTSTSKKAAAKRRKPPRFNSRTGRSVFAVLLRRLHPKGR